MEKYGTYKIFRHKVTGELKREPIGSSEEELEKLAQDNNWEELGEEPEYE